MTREINLGNLIIPLIKPQKGIDYYTSAEKQEIVNEVTNNVNDVILPQEEIRQSNEITRQNNENTRQAQETSRTISENERQNAETERIEAESIRQDNESSRESAEQERTETFNTQMQAVNTAIQGIHTSQEAYDQNAQEKTTAFNTNATNKMNAYNTNATEKIEEYDAHVHDYEQELANKVDKVAGKVLSTNDFTNEKSQQIETNKTAIQINAGAITALSGRVTEVEDDIVDIQEEQAEQNTSIENLQEENTKLKNQLATQKEIINQLPQVSGEGESVTLNNTIKAPFTLFSPEGHSEQESTSIADGDEYDSPSPEHEQPIKSAGENVNEFDGEMELGTIANTNGGNFNSSSNTRSKNYIPVKSNTTYTFSDNINGSFIVHGYDENKNWIKILIAKNFEGLATFNTTEDTKYIRFRTNETDLTAKWKLEPGSTATPYSPYGMGSITEKIVNGNLLKITENNLVVHCSYVSGANTNQYKLLCTASDMYVNQIKEAGASYDETICGNLIPCKQGETLYFDVGNPLFTGCYFTEYDKNLKSLGPRGINSSSGTYTPTNINCAFVTFRGGYGRNAVPGTTYTLAPIVSKTPINSYVPHEEQTYSIYTQQPFRSIGDVRDVFFKNTVDSPYYDENLILNGWYERHDINRVILDGTENWLIAGNNDDFSRYYTNTNYPLTAKREKILCSHFKYGIVTDLNKNCIGPYNGSTNYGVNICISNAIASNANELKTWLSNNNVILDYILKEPLDLPCTQSQIDILENIPSTFAGQTNVFSEDEVKAYLRAKGLKDLNTLDSEINNVKQAIVALGGVV
jgi:hypothetical protein